MRNDLPLPPPVTLPIGLTKKHRLFQALGRRLKTPWARKALNWQLSHHQLIYLLVCALEMIHYDLPDEWIGDIAKDILRKLVRIDCSFYHFCVEWCDRAEADDPDKQTYEARKKFLSELFARLQPQCQAVDAAKRPTRKKNLPHSCRPMRAQSGPGAASKPLKKRQAAVRQRQPDAGAVHVAA